MLLSDWLLQLAEDIIYGAVLFAAVYFGVRMALYHDKRASYKSLKAMADDVRKMGLEILATNEKNRESSTRD